MSSRLQHPGVVGPMLTMRPSYPRGAILHHAGFLARYTLPLQPRSGRLYQFSHVGSKWVVECLASNLWPCRIPATRGLRFPKRHQRERSVQDQTAVVNGAAKAAYTAIVSRSSRVECCSSSAHGLVRASTHARWAFAARRTPAGPPRNWRFASALVPVHSAQRRPRADLGVQTRGQLA